MRPVEPGEPMSMPPNRRRVSTTPGVDESRRSGREAPCDEKRERCRGEERVPEQAEAGPIAAVEPDEEEPRHEEVGAEVEEVQQGDERRDAEDGPLERSLPGHPGKALPALDPARMVERRRPVGSQREAGGLVGGDRPEHDRGLDEGVAAGRQTGSWARVVA